MDGAANRISSSDDLSINAVAKNIPVALFQAQLVAGHLFGIPNIHSAVRDHRMVPSLALDGMKSRQLFMSLRIGGQQDGFAGFRNHQEHRLIGKQHNLSSAVAAFLPTSLSRREIDAAEDADVEPIYVAL